MKITATLVSLQIVMIQTLAQAGSGPSGSQLPCTEQINQVLSYLGKPSLDSPSYRFKVGGGSYNYTGLFESPIVSHRKSENLSMDEYDKCDKAQKLEPPPGASEDYKEKVNRYRRLSGTISSLRRALNLCGNSHLTCSGDLTAKLQNQLDEVTKQQTELEAIPGQEDARNKTLKDYQNKLQQLVQDCGDAQEDRANKISKFTMSVCEIGAQSCLESKDRNDLEGARASLLEQRDSLSKHLHNINTLLRSLAGVKEISKDLYREQADDALRTRKNLEDLETKIEDLSLRLKSNREFKISYDSSGDIIIRRGARQSSFLIDPTNGCSMAMLGAGKSRLDSKHRLQDCVNDAGGKVQFTEKPLAR